MTLPSNSTARSAARLEELRELFRQMFDRERREDDDARSIYRHMAQRPTAIRGR